MERPIASDSSAEHSETNEAAAMDENVPVVRSLPHETNSNHMSRMKNEEISSEYQSHQADQIQPIPIIDTKSKSNNHISSSTEINQSKATEVVSTASHQTPYETNPNDTFDASESGPSSSAISDMTNLHSVSSNPDAENERSSDGDTNENDPIKGSQSKHVRDELDLFCYVCNYGFKSFPRLIRHMETKKHANQVEKYHAMNSSRHCFSAGTRAGPMAGCDQYPHVHQHRPPPPHLMPPSLRRPPQQQMLFQQPVHPLHHPPHHHHQLYHYQQTAVTTMLGHNEMELLPEDVINQMINSLGEDMHDHSDAFSEFETTDLNEMLEYLQ